MGTTGRGWRGRRRRDRGAVLVESVVALPVALLLLVGTIEVGSMMKTYSSTASAVRSAARVAAVAGADPMADQRILAADRPGVSRDPADADPQDRDLACAGPRRARPGGL